MTAFGVIALVFFSILFVLAVGIAALFIGAYLARSQHAAKPVAATPAYGFVQRLPGQEPGYVEIPTNEPTFEQNLRAHGRAFVLIQGKTEDKR
jgi:hypothetical protein